MGFLNGVKRFSSRVTACSKKLKSKTPGFLNGVSRFSSRCVTGCSRKSKSKTPAFTACSRESKSKTPETQEKPELWMHATLKAVDAKKGSWVTKLDKLMNDLAGIEGLRSCVCDENGKIHISGTIDRALFMRHVRKFKESGKIDVEHFQFGNCSSHLFRKKEAPSTKNTNPSTNSANPPTNNANTRVGCYQPQGYGSYYGNVGLSGNGGYSNAYGNGGYYDYFGYNGGYNGNSYNYQPEPAVYQKRIGYDYIDCAGDASECSGHHNERQ